MSDQTPRAYAGWDISGNGVTLTEQVAVAFAVLVFAPFISSRPLPQSKR